MATSDAPAFVASLHRAGLRVTAPRRAVLGALGEAGHLNAAAIAAVARARLGRLSTQAVYDNLDALSGAGLVRRIEPAGSPALYELRTGDNHHHAICRTCGSIRDVDCAAGAAPCLEQAKLDRFQVDEAEVIFWGFCSACQAEAGTISA